MLLRQAACGSRSVACTLCGKSILAAKLEEHVAAGCLDRVPPFGSVEVCPEAAEGHLAWARDIRAHLASVVLGEHAAPPVHDGPVKSLETNDDAASQGSAQMDCDSPVVDTEVEYHYRCTPCDNCFLCHHIIGTQ